MTQTRQRVCLLGIELNGYNLDEVADEITRAAKEQQRLGVTALAMHAFVGGLRDTELRYCINSIDIKLADGFPIFKAASWIAGRKWVRIRGHRLVKSVLRECAKENIPVFLYGGKANTLAKLDEVLPIRYPGLIIAGKQPGRFREISEAEQMSDVEKIRSSGARIVLVGLGCPRQEYWIYRNLSYLNCPVIAVGAALDYESGLLRPPPEFIQTSGFEWLWRLCSDPLRLWRRYLIDGPVFLWFVFLFLFGIFEIIDRGTQPANPPNIG